MAGGVLTDCRGDVRNQCTLTPTGNRKVFVSPVLLLLVRLIQDSVFVAASESIESPEKRSTRGAEATREAREWIATHTPEKSDLWIGSWEWACAWLTVWGSGTLCARPRTAGICQVSINFTRACRRSQRADISKRRAPYFSTTSMRR